MASYAELLAHQRRRVMLQTLLISQGFRANDAVLRSVVESRVEVSDRALIRADLGYLEQHGIVTIERLAHEGQDIWRATLTDSGAGVARGRHHPGIADIDLA